jgi:hypothetical protein
VDSLTGAAGLRRDRRAEASHSLQDDQGEEMARRLDKFFAVAPLRRVFATDVLACPDCGGRLRLLATIEERCDLPGIVGTCGDVPIIAPVASRTGLLVGFCILAAFAALGLQRRREIHRHRAPR